MKREKHALNGWINLYKPKSMGSTQAVSAVKRLLRPTKIGHAGTLDPLAEGVLPLALGEATKTVPYLVDAQKQYLFSVCWGEARSTDDAEGEVIERHEKRPSSQEITNLLPKFTGRIMQIPPAYSALKIDGKRAYDLARAGQDVVLKAREVEIFDLTLTSDNVAETTFRVTCSKGTYVRSLARDIAHALGTVGYVSYLKRERVGQFDAATSISLDFLEDFLHNAPKPELVALAKWLLPLSVALDDIPALTIDAVAEKALKQGRFLPDTAQATGQYLALYHEGQLVAIAHRQDGLLKPKRVFNY